MSEKNQSPIYLYTGPEIGAKEDTIAQLRANIEKKYSSIDFYKYYWNDIEFSEIISQLQNENLFIPCTFIVLDGAEAIKTKGDIALLKSWLSSPGNAYLVLTTVETNIDKKLKDIVPKENQKTFWEMFDEKKEEWISDYFRKNGYSITNDAIQDMLDMVENNTSALKTAATMVFAAFQKGSTINEENIEAVLASTREESPFTLFNTMVDEKSSPASRFESALVILHKLLYARSASGVAIIAGLSYCFKQLRLWNELLSSSQVPERSPMFTNKSAQKRYRAASRIYDLSRTAAIIALMAEADIKMRSSGSALEAMLLEKMLYEIIIKGGAKCSAFEEQISI